MTGIATITICNWLNGRAKSQTTWILDHFENGFLSQSINRLSSK